MNCPAGVEEPWVENLAVGLLGSVSYSLLISANGSCSIKLCTVGIEIGGVSLFPVHRHR